MDGLREYYTQWNKWDKTHTQILYDITWMWKQKNNTNDSTCKIKTDSDVEDRLIVTSEKRGGGSELEARDN